MEVGACQQCGNPLPPPKRSGAPPRKWCSEKCAKRAHYKRGDNPLLPIAPFREYLQKRRQNYDSDKEMARALSIPVRVLFRWLHESDFVHLDAVDATLVDDSSVLLDELYPYGKVA